jgi:hypothetical protein
MDDELLEGYEVPVNMWDQDIQCQIHIKQTALREWHRVVFDKCTQPKKVKIMGGPHTSKRLDLLTASHQPRILLLLKPSHRFPEESDEDEDVESLPPEALTYRAAPESDDD